jgi:hypothetical protein
MPLAKLIAGAAHRPAGPRDSNSLAAEHHFHQYLADNVVVSETLRSMRHGIQVFLSYAPRMLVSKCIDGRVHGSVGKGYPPTTVTFSRTDGNRVALTRENMHFWNRVNAVVLSARHHTPGCPALFIALGHHAKLGHGCAAHQGNDAEALATVREQAVTMQAKYNPRDLYVVYGMTNTDDGAERLVFLDGHEVDSAAIIALLDTPRMPLKAAADLFQASFLDRLVDDRPTDHSLGGRTPRQIVHGADARMFHDVQTMIAMQTYLLQDVSQVVNNESRNNVVFEPRVFDEVRRTLEAVHDLPPRLLAPLLYQTLWNIAYTLHERERLMKLEGVTRRHELEHAENKVGYGEGFELERRNRLVLAKPGRGDDQLALQVARNVLLNNRKLDPQPHPPLVHVNVELAGDVDSWEAFNRDVLAPLLTRIENVHTVFGDDCRVLTTYSRTSEKCFYPVRINPDVGPLSHPEEDHRQCYPADVTRGLPDQNFHRQQLALREQVYKHMMLLEATGEGYTAPDETDVT